MSCEREAKNLRDLEQEVHKELDPVVGEHVAHAAEVFDLIVRVNNLFDDEPLTKVSASALSGLMLLARIANDIRAICVLGSIGYGAQACGLAATIW